MFKNKYAEIRSGWALALSIIPILLIQFGLGVVVGFIAMLKAGLGSVISNTEEYLNVVAGITDSPWMNYLMYTLMIGLLLLTFWLIYKRPLRLLGFYRKAWASQLALGGLIGVGAMSLAVLILVITGSASLNGFNWAGPASIMFWAGLVKYAFVGFFEEIFSRGYMMTALKTTRNKWIIILAPAVIFGLLHAMNANVTFFSLANIALVGVLFAYLFIKTGRLWAPIGLHITWNFFQGYIFGVPVSGVGVPLSAMTSTTFTGPVWLTGGAFGIEGGAACTLVILLGLVFTYFFVQQQDCYWRIDKDLPLTRGSAPGESVPASYLPE